ncbi:MAG: hypothetical protein Q8L48_10285 [Archangium sp.]|nr:hypothetical protein [Archangium sp.]
MKPDQAVHALYVQRNRKLGEEEIAELLSALEQSPTFPSAFVREAMRAAKDGARQAHWVETLKALSRTTRQYSVGDKSFVATLTFLQEPWLLDAVRAGVVQEAAPLTALAALAKDGSEASHDALLAEFERARRDKSDWALRYKLKRLGRYAKHTPHWDALEQAVQAELARRDGAKQSGSLAQRLGLNVPLLRFSLTLTGRARGEKERPWLWLQGDDRHPNFKSQALKLDSQPPQDFTQVAAWLTRVTKTGHLTWDWAGAKLVTNLRGKHRDAMVAWLKGERSSPADE